MCRIPVQEGGKEVAERTAPGAVRFSGYEA